MNVGDVIDRHRLVVCVGTGGVGKTTLAAAVALGGAVRGRRAMALTIDPAHQLARALGLARLDPGGERVDEAVLREAGLAPRGTLDAAMLDQKRAWDGLIERHAPDARLRDAILRNPFYTQLSTSFAGAIEYAAMEELCRLDESGDYDLIVLDTPPTGGALDFLRAPQRLDQLLLDPDVISWLARPFAGVGKGAWRTAGRVVQGLLRRLERATGGQTLRDISSFFVAIQALFSQFQRRTAQARALLRSPQTAFLLVAGPNEQVLAATHNLQTEVATLGAPLRAVILNRAHPLMGAAPDPTDATAVLQALARTGADAAAVGWLRRAFDRALITTRIEADHWHRFEASLPADVARAVIPEGDRDLHSMAGLAGLTRRLWPD